MTDSPARTSGDGSAVDVLVVCRDAVSGKWLVEYLASRGMRVELGAFPMLHAQDGHALGRFDVLLLDARELGESDLAVLQRARESSPLTEIIIISKRALVDDAVQALRGGAFAILHRPVRADQLAATILAAWERKRRAEGRLKALCESGGSMAPGEVRGRSADRRG